MLSFLRTLFGNTRPVARTTRHQFRPHLSQLDDRIVPAINVTQSGATVTITGVPGSTRGAIGILHSATFPGRLGITEAGGPTRIVTLPDRTQFGGNTVVIDFRGDAQADTVRVNFFDEGVGDPNTPKVNFDIWTGGGSDGVSIQQTPNLTQVAHVFIHGGDGDDTVTLSTRTSRWVQVVGGTGRDVIQMQGSFGWQRDEGTELADLEDISVGDYFATQPVFGSTSLNQVLIRNGESVPTVRTSPETRIVALQIVAPSVALDLQGEVAGQVFVSVPDFNVIGDAVAPERLADVWIRGRVGGTLTVNALNALVNVSGTVVGAARTNDTPRTLAYATNSVTVAQGGVVEGGLTVGQANLSGGRAVVEVHGRVGGNLLVYGSSVSDVVLVNTGATVGGAMTVRTGGGNDYVFVYGTVGANAGSQLTDLRTGDGNDWVEVGSTARVETFSAVLDGGYDTFVLYSGASFSSMLVGGGADRDSFYGNRTLPNLWVGTFEEFG